MYRFCVFQGVIHHYVHSVGVTKQIENVQPKESEEEFPMHKLATVS